MSLYLDTSVVIPLFVDEELSPTVASWIIGQGVVPIVADLTVTECHAVISRLIRSRKIDEDRGATIRELLTNWLRESAETLEHLSSDIRFAAQLVQAPLPKLLTADEIHLATCRRLELTLVTLDRDLQSICKRERVPWASPH